MIRIKKETPTQVFPINITKFLRVAFLQNFYGGCFCILLKVIKQPFRKVVTYDAGITFSVQHILETHIV